jgi:adenosylhomocysteine nucleosidase
MIGIISAMHEEIDAILENLTEIEKTVKGKRTYFKGVLFNKPVVLTFSRWGKVASAATTTQLINDFNPSEIIFTGVAGAIKTHLEIGDIVIGKNLYQHDLDASPLFDKFTVPILNKKYFSTQNSDKLIAAASEFIANYSQYVEKSKSDEFSINKPKVVFGDIASGDQFVNNINTILELNNSLPTALCVEMEGAAVAQVCFEYEIPFSIVRIISDKANDNAGIDFPKFAKLVASQYALGILKQYFNKV